MLFLLIHFRYGSNTCSHQDAKYTKVWYRCVTLHFRDPHGRAWLCCRNRAQITFLNVCVNRSRIRYDFPGASNEKIWEKTWKNNKAWIKLSKTILSILSCTTLPASLMEEFPASKVHLQPATWLTGKFPRRRMSRHHRPVGSGHRAKLSPSVGRGGEGFRQTADSSYLSAIL